MSKSKRNRTAGQQAAEKQPTIKDVADQMNAEDTAVVDDGHPDVPPEVPPVPEDEQFPPEVAGEPDVATEPTVPLVPEDVKVVTVYPADGWLGTKAPTIKRCRVVGDGPEVEYFEIGLRNQDRSGRQRPERTPTSIARSGNDICITFESNDVKSRSVLVNVPVELQYDDK